MGRGVVTEIEKNKKISICEEEILNPLWGMLIMNTKFRHVRDVQLKVKSTILKKYIRESSVL